MLTVSQLNKYVAFKIRSDVKLKSVSVKGEISNFNLNYKSGHAYFSVKDNEASVKAVMFSTNVQKLKVNVENGMSVLVTGRIDVYEPDGVYQIIVSEIVPLGAGIVHMQTQMIKEKLLKQGIFDDIKKKSIPLVPKKIAVVTSMTGAALQDILNITKRRYPICNVEIYPSLMQGEKAEKSVCNALSEADKSGADTIILARGGGSAEDLMPFNSEAVTIAVYNCITPVITAVGHETDTTLVDYAADMRAPTPSAAAELAVPDKDEMIAVINILHSKMSKAFELYINALYDKIHICEYKISTNSPETKLAENERSVQLCMTKLSNAISMKINILSERLDGAVSSINMLSPFNVLNRGYSLVCDKKNGSVINNASSLKCGDTVSIQFSNGTAEAEITKID